MAQQVQEKKESSSFREKLLEGLFGAKQTEKKYEGPKPLGEPVKEKFGTKDGYKLTIDELKSGIEANYFINS